MEKESLTPMMKQFHDLKSQHPDAILLFRCGDFYETYCEDAVTASQILGITLTRRNNKGTTASTEMAGFPHHALDTYLPKLIRAGHRVAICDQLEDPKLTKKLVKRGITELVTPGVALTDNVLNCKENNFLAAIHFGRGTCGVAFLDISTGEFLVGEGTPEYVDKLLANFAPKEILYERGRRRQFEENFGTRYFVFELDDWAFSEATARGKLLKHFQVNNLKGFGIDHLTAATVAAGAVMTYLELTQHTQTAHIAAIHRIEEERYVRLDKFSIRNLELIQPMNEGGTSLLSVIDRTLTPMGARLLHRWLLFPLRDVKAIAARQDGVEYFFREPAFREQVHEQLSVIGDLERIVSKVAVGRVTPREMQQLRLALDAITPLKEVCEQATDDTLHRMSRRLDPCSLLRDRIARELRPDPTALRGKGGYIADGVKSQHDVVHVLGGGPICVLVGHYSRRIHVSHSRRLGVRPLAHKQKARIAPCALLPDNIVCVVEIQIGLHPRICYEYVVQRVKIQIPVVSVRLGTYIHLRAVYERAHPLRGRHKAYDTVFRLRIQLAVQALVEVLRGGHLVFGRVA